MGEEVSEGFELRPGGDSTPPKTPSERLVDIVAVETSDAASIARGKHVSFGRRWLTSLSNGGEEGLQGNVRCETQTRVTIVE